MGMEVVLMQPYVVLVLYQTPWEKVPSRAILMKWLAENKLSGLMVYDNSLQDQDHPDFTKEGINYSHHPENLGLSVAYQSAFEQMPAKTDWLLLLDQDTLLTEAYLMQASQMMQTATNQPIAVIVPKIVASQQQISPIYADEYIRSGFQAVDSGLTNDRLMAINSASLWQRDFLKLIGGFSKEFPLDFLDHWLFYEVYQKQWQIAVLNTTLTHDLSVFDYEKVSVRRYESILAAEKRYYTCYETRWLNKHRQQLFKRALKQFLTVKNRQIWKLTLKAFWHFNQKEGVK